MQVPSNYQQPESARPIPEDLRSFLDFKVNQYNRPEFIDQDPVTIPHLYSRKEDIEIAGFLIATLSWGSRATIIRNGGRLMERLDHAPYDFVLNHGLDDLQQLKGFVHRTFNGMDLEFFITSLKNIYLVHGGLESVFTVGCTPDSTQPAIVHVRNLFFSIPHPERTTRHFSDPSRGSAAKRINMFLRWMVRQDNRGVDFGLWKKIRPDQLSCPLDVHSGNVARKLGLLTRNTNDARALGELDRNLRLLDSKDPVKYDFALFGLGVFERY